MVTIIKDTNYQKIAENYKPDTKRRILLPRSIAVEGITYHVYVNDSGQIILDPQVTIPASELWVFQNKEILASIDKGMTESINGQAVKHGSFAKYAKDEA
jgi:hypothetical protein